MLYPDGHSGQGGAESDATQCLAGRAGLRYMPISMAIDVKICGLREPAAFEAAIGGGARWAGLVFYPPSPRAISPEAAFALSRLCHGTPCEPVGVYVDPDESLLAATAEAIAWFQLHGTETPEQVAAIRRRWNKPVIKAIAVADRTDLERAAAYAPVADRLLFDAKPRPGDLPGGTGRRFAWELLADFDPGIPWILSGGLTAGTLAEAVAASGATAVDVSSGVEEMPGRKSVDKIADFLDTARRISARQAKQEQLT